MRQITYQQLKKDFAGELKNIPFEVTVAGKVVYSVVKPDYIDWAEKSGTELYSLKSGMRSKFDYDKPQACASCHKVYPAILMEFHSHVRHGV